MRQLDDDLTAGVCKSFSRRMAHRRQRTAIAGKWPSLPEHLG
jgi:hypothetical protein